MKTHQLKVERFTCENCGAVVTFESKRGVLHRLNCPCCVSKDKRLLVCDEDVDIDKEEAAKLNMEQWNLAVEKYGGKDGEG